MTEMPFDLDKDSVDFLESKLHAKINPHIETEKDMYRNIFYFKCCALQDENLVGDVTESGFAVRDCFFDKAKADILFENVYAHATEFKDLTEKVTTATDPAQMEKLMADFMQYSESGMAAQTMTLNEFLTPQLHNINMEGRDVGNAQIMQTASMQQFSGYLNAFPDLAKDMNEKYSDMVVKACAEIAPLLPKDADKKDYLEITAKHPKEVLALAVMAQTLAENGRKSMSSISSPQDLAQKCQLPNIMALADKISFNDLSGSLKDTYTAAKNNDKLKTSDKVSYMARVAGERGY